MKPANASTWVEGEEVEPVSIVYQTHGDVSKTSLCECCMLMWTPCVPMGRAAALVGESYAVVAGIVAVLYTVGVICFGVSSVVDGPLLHAAVYVAVPAGWALSAFGPVITIPFDVIVDFHDSLKYCGDEDQPLHHENYNVSTAASILATFQIVSQLLVVATGACLRRQLNNMSGTEPRGCHWLYSCICPAASLADAMATARHVDASRHLQQNKKETDELPAYVV